MIIEIVDDDVKENNEAFVLILTVHNALSIVTHPSRTSVIILDNDGMFKTNETLLKF